MKVEIAAPELEGAVREWLARPGLGEAVKDNRVRSVHRWNGLYVKRFKHPGVLQGLRGRVSDRAAHEFRVLKRLRRLGIAAPEPVAWARDGAATLLFTREIPDAVPLRSLPMTRPLLLELAAFVRSLHDAGLRDDDLHVGNILRAGGRLHVVDLHRAALRPRLTPGERTAGVAFVVLSFYTLVPATEVLRFIRACGADPVEVTRVFRRQRDRYYRDRQARAWQTGSDFEARDGLVLRRPATEAEGRRALESPPIRTVKEIPNRRLWLSGPRTFVKEGARKAWSNAFGLETRGIPTPRLIACSGNRVAGEWIEGALPLWEHLKAQGVSRDLIWRLAAVVRRMHVRGVYHKDLKANNILVRGAEVWVIDLDRVEFMLEVPRAGRIWNLAQLNAAVGPPATRTDRLRFLFAYAARDPAIRRGWKRWAREIMRRTVERRHVWPNPGESRMTNHESRGG